MIKSDIFREITTKTRIKMTLGLVHIFQATICPFISYLYYFDFSFRRLYASLIHCMVVYIPLHMIATSGTLLIWPVENGDYKFSIWYVENGDYKNKNSPNRFVNVKCFWRNEKWRKIFVNHIKPCKPYPYTLSLFF